MAKADVIKEFTKLKGVGPAKAELLYKSGFTSLEKLKSAKISDLTKIDGITDTNAKELLAQFKATGKTKPKTQKKPVAKPKIAEKTIEEKKPAKKPEPKTKEPVEKETKEESKEELVVVEDEEKGYKVKIKPKLDKKQKERLALRKEIKNRTPQFLREEWFRYKRIPKNWGRPDGISSKMRRNYKYRPSKVRVGFRGPKDVRGLHPSGFEEVMISNVAELESVDPKKQAVRINGAVGTKKRLEISKKADELDIRILNV